MSDASTAGRVYWFTGLSGVGKSTVCRRFVERLRARGHSVVMLDGDELRDVLGAESAHARSDRLALAFRYARLCRLISLQGIDVAIATISLFREIHEWNRNNLRNYREILLTAPLSELALRDPKKIYERAARGEIANVAGVDLAVDMPESPDLEIAFEPGLTPEAAVERVMAFLEMDRAE